MNKKKEEDDRPSLPPEKVAYDKGFLDGLMHNKDKPFVYCPYCGNRLAIVFWAHVCGLPDID
jgi:hypothetical protein